MAFQEILRTSRNHKTFNSLSYKQYLSMIIKKIRIFSQNIHKKNLLTNTILEVQKEFDIIFIQKPLWSFI